MPRQRIHIARPLDGQVWRFLPRSLPRRLIHRHTEPEFNFITRGTAGYLVDGQRYELTRNTLIWLLPEQDHLLIDESRDFEMWIAVFRMPLLRRLVRSDAPTSLLAGKPDRASCHHLAEPLTTRLAELLDHTFNARQDPPLFNASLAHLALAAWRMHEQADDSHDGQDVHSAVQRAAQLIRQSPEDADFQAIAGRSGLSLSRLTRLFKQQMGLPMVQFRQQQRLRRFMALLGRGRRRNLTQAALEAGFGSYPQFHRIFTQTHGCSPQTYLRIAGRRQSLAAQ